MHTTLDLRRQAAGIDLLVDPPQELRQAVATVGEILQTV